MSKEKQNVKDTKNKEGTQTPLVISPRQSSSLIASTLIGVGVLTLPRVTASEAQEAAWMATILGAIIAVMVLVVITKIGFRFPKKGIVSYSASILGSDKKKWWFIGRLLSLPIVFILLGYWLTTTAMIARTFGEVVVTAVLRQTPLEVTIITMLLTALLLVMYDVEVLARVNEILLPIIVIPVLFIAFLSFQSFQLEFILPVWPGLSLRDFFMGVLLTLFAYQGYELITVFSAYTHITKKTMRLNIIGLLIPAFVYLLIVIAGVSVFGNEELSMLMWPTLELVKVTQVPGLILERMESAFLGVWVAAVFTTTANVYYATTIVTSQFFGLEKYRRWIGLAFLPLLFFLSLQPDNVIALFEWQQYIGYTGLFASFVFPLLLTVIAKIRKKGVKEIPYEEDEQGVRSDDSPTSGKENDNV
jgi:spore germination protein